MSKVYLKHENNNRIRGYVLDSYDSKNAKKTVHMAKMCYLKNEADYKIRLTNITYIPSINEVLLHNLIN